ncbi:MAG: alpha/beta hydrolase [Bacteroidales bacterium]|nr:alpha/beta hydrolase [Bacteroidales bacterium]MBQ9530155.1 alpha/beta hydrolase [Bacteroidales bacterium]
MRRIFLTLTILFAALIAWAQDADTTLVPRGQVKPEKDSIALPPVTWDMEVAFATRDTCTLSMDIYFPKDDKEKHPCVLFVYGGGFVQNNQKEASVRSYCRRLADAGFVAVATDYRLGLKGVKNSSLMTMADNLDRAIQLSTEDLFSAVEYLITYSDELCIDPSQIILAGSSAGAITVLQADYELGNRTQLAAAMPADFRFAGVISFSGAIFSRKGKCKWTVQPPAPTLFLHGTSDELVTYNKIQVFNLGFFGTNQLVERFEKFDYPYMCIRFENRYHEVAAFMNGFFNQTVGFIEQFVFNKKNWQVDVTFTDPDFDLAKPWAFTPKDLYK